MISLFILISFSISESSNSPAQENISPVAYYQCVSVVRMIDHQIRKMENPYRRQRTLSSGKHHEQVKNQIDASKTILETSDINVIGKIIQSLSKSCDELTDTRKSVCKDILKEEIVQKIYALIKQNQKPNFICLSIGYKRSSSSISRIIDKNFCSQVIDLIKADINKYSQSDKWELHRPKLNPASNNLKIKRSNFFQSRKAFQACKQFIQTSNYQQCLMLSRIVMNEAISQIQSSNSSDSICNYLESKKFIQFTG